MARKVTEWKVRVTCADTDAAGKGQHRPFGLGFVEWERDEAPVAPTVRAWARADEGKCDYFQTPDHVGRIRARRGAATGTQSHSSYRLRCPRCRRDVRIQQPEWDVLFETLRTAQVSTVDLAQLERVR